MAAFQVAEAFCIFTIVSPDTERMQQQFNSMT